MKKNLFVSLALASAFLIPVSGVAQFADSVVSFNQGSVGPSYVDFSHVDTTLGAPSQINPYFENTDPFNPPYGTNQIVSIGAGGSLTLHVAAPILNSPSNPYGIDFIIFGNTGFVITNEFDLETFTFVGTPATDGSLFGDNPGVTRVSVSADGMNWFTLNPALARTVDALFPTYGSGDPLMPVDPNLTADDFSGQTLSGIESLYNGSAGGAGFDLAWAQDGEGNAANLTFADYVRIEVLSGQSEIDAVSVVPEPTTLTITVLGTTLICLQRRKNRPGV